MSVVYRVAKNYTLPLSVVVLVLSTVGVVISFDPILRLFQPLAPGFYVQVLSLGSWRLWILLLSMFGLMGGAWYLGEQLVRRRKFERLLETDKRSDFTSSRKELDELARTLPDRYKPRIHEKEAQFKTRR